MSTMNDENGWYLNTLYAQINWNVKQKTSDVRGWRATNDVNFFLLRMLFIEQMINQSYAHKMTKQCTSFIH
jgi:hypothetical protein